MESKKEKVLVTGASGYIAGHIIVILLNLGKNICLKLVNAKCVGFKVRGTVRSKTSMDKALEILKIVPSKKDNLELVQCDLTIELGWNKAVEGCE